MLLFFNYLLCSFYYVFIFLVQKEAVYGLTEILRKEIKSARLVANPGCYPTSIQLPLVPLFKVCILYRSSLQIASLSWILKVGRWHGVQTVLKFGLFFSSWVTNLMLVRISLFSMVLAHALCVEFVLISHSNRSQHSGSLIGRFCRLISFNIIILLSMQNLVLVEQVRMHLQFLTFLCKIYPYMLVILLMQHFTVQDVVPRRQIYTLK